MTTYKRQIKDKDGNVIYPDVGIDLDNVVYSDDPEEIDDIIDPNSYSTTEAWTGGYWIDGKKIYKRTFDYGYLPNATVKRMTLTDFSYDRIVNVELDCDNGSGKGYLWLSSSNAPATTGFNAYITASTSTPEFVINASTDRSSLYAYITIYYTKSS